MLHKPSLPSTLIFILFLLLPPILSTVRKCDSHVDCNLSAHEFCLNKQCITRHTRAQCLDNDDCNQNSGSQWLKCLKDPDEAWGHCHPATVRYVSLTDEMHADEEMWRHMLRIARNGTDQVGVRTDVELHDGTSSNTESEFLLLSSITEAMQNLTLSAKHQLIHHMRNVSTLHYPICKLLNHSSEADTRVHHYAPRLSDSFLHYFHEVVFGDDDLDEANATESSTFRFCGTHKEAKNIEAVEARANVNVSHEAERFSPPPRSTATPYITSLQEAMDATSDEFPIPLCGYGICDNPHYRKKFFSIDQIHARGQTRIVFLHFHVMPSVQFADQRIAAVVRRVNEFYSPGKIMFMAFVSNYEGRFRSCKVAREQEIAECIRTIGALNCALDVEIIEDIYGPDWRKRGSYHVIVGDLFLKQLLGWSHFVWVSDNGLVTIANSELDVRSTTLAHELGHAVGGLHHVFRGREQVSTSSEAYGSGSNGHTCGKCIENEPSDWTGDMCYDTAPTPENFFCRNPTVSEHRDVCNPRRLTWNQTPYANLMSYAPSSCHTHLTNDQFERIHCWISQNRNAYHMLTADEEARLRQLQVDECFTRSDGSDYRGSFDDFGACKPWPSSWWSAEWGILPGDNACRNPNPAVNPGLWCFYGENGQNPTLCAESGTAIFMNRTCTKGQTRYDARYQTLMEETRECFESPLGADYRGTHSEEYCVNWPFDEPQHGVSTQHNYCRNPNPDMEKSKTPWCFTQPGGKSPRYCRDVLMQNHRRSCPRIPPQAELKQECYTQENFSDYRGRFNNHGRCDFWPHNDPANGISMSHNFCRNPDGAPYFWCYENSYTKKAIYCETRETERFLRAECSRL